MIVPLDLAAANAYFTTRHQPPVANALFCIGLEEGEQVVGAIAMDTTGTDALRLARVCSDGSTGGYTTLYGAAWRAAKALGYKAIVI